MNSTHDAASALPASAQRPASRHRKIGWLVSILLALALGVVAWVRVGALDLPRVPSSLTPTAAGLAGLDEMKKLDALIWSVTPSNMVLASSEATLLVQRGLAEHRAGNTVLGLEHMREGIRREPNNLVLANCYRMIVFGLRRDFLAASRREAVATPKFPPELARQPIGFFEELDQQHHTRETKLNLALAWVDEMLLFPALEIKAPCSVQAVDLLTAVLEKDDPDYVPALFARGLNHLHRPARLVWPESTRTPRDAAVRDLGKCVAIGRHIGGGSARLQATLALCLGDGYVKAGRLSVARSWWQISQNLCRDPDLQAAIRRRYAWQNEEVLDRLEEELDRGRSQLQHPMTDLALMWN
jgi:hypothetical protein